MAQKNVRVPPRWFERLAWRAHRGIYRISGGRLGLWLPKPGKWGAFRLTTIGRRSGRERSVILGYFEDGDDLVTMAMNGWTAGEPMWWLNLQAHPEARVEVKGGSFWEPPDSDPRVKGMAADAWCRALRESGAEPPWKHLVILDVDAASVVTVEDIINAAATAEDDQYLVPTA